MTVKIEARAIKGTDNKLYPWSYHVVKIWPDGHEVVLHVRPGFKTHGSAISQGVAFLSFATSMDKSQPTDRDGSKSSSW